MSELCDRPYSQFNFQVQFGPGNLQPDAAFQEVSGLEQENPLDHRESHPGKISGLHKIGDVTMKRGVVGDSATLWAWLQQVSEGDPGAGREVSITMLDENRQPAALWKLQAARPMK